MAVVALVAMVTAITVVAWPRLHQLMAAQLGSEGGLENWAREQRQLRTLEPMRYPMPTSVDEFVTVQLGWEGGRDEWRSGQGQLKARGDAAYLPPEWDSTTCMQSWGQLWLQTNPDPAGRYTNYFWLAHNNKEFARGGTG